jgi:hypothetical protein
LLKNIYFTESMTQSKKIKKTYEAIYVKTQFQ